MCKSRREREAFPTSQWQHARQGTRNFFLRCRRCHTCVTCGTVQNIRAFTADAKTCSACQNCLCEACGVSKPVAQFDENVLRHARTGQRRSVCSSCQAIGVSPKDVTIYRCQGCGDRGHPKFSTDTLRNARRPDRDDALVCDDCIVRRQRIQKVLRARDSLTCTCPGPAKERRHLPSNEKCTLNPRHFGNRRWPGQNLGVTQEDLHFLERVAKRRKL